MKKSKLKAISYIISGNEKAVKNYPKNPNFHKQKILESISKALSNYYSSHPNEINNLK